jgi:hypothetical protein
MIRIPILEQNYVHPKAFHVEIKSCQHFGELSDDLIDTFHLIVENISKPMNSPHKYKYALGAFSECIKNWKCFDPNKSENPFGYFSEVAKRGFAKEFNRSRNSTTSK